MEIQNLSIFSHILTEIGGQKQPNPMLYLIRRSVFAKVKRQETRDCVMTSLLDISIRRLPYLRNLGNKCLE